MPTKVLQCIFKNIAVSGQNTISADSNNDTLTFAGSGIAITTDDTTDTVTFTVTDAGGTVTCVELLLVQQVQTFQLQEAQ